MRINKYNITLIFLLMGISIAYSQENRTEIFVDFRVNSTVIDTAYSDNAISIHKLEDFLRDIRQDSTINIVGVSFCGVASPEGSYQLNRKLAYGRLTALENFVRREVNIPDSLITRNDNYIPWEYLKSKIKDSELRHKNEVISIIDEEARLVDYIHPNTHIDNRIVRLRQLDDGEVWRQMNRLFFEKMRNACVEFVIYKEKQADSKPQTSTIDTIAVEQKQVVDVTDAVIVESKPIEDVAQKTIDAAYSVKSDVEKWSRKLYIKTNILGLGLGIANATAEVDLARHWSFALPIYYSAWDYFKTTIKFRTLATMPEFRYWFSKNNNGFFAGAHFGLSYYNLAIDGDYRFQDHNRETPAIGGGISVGYRLPISRNNRWQVEFLLGAGVYPLYYDKFYNTTNTKDGLMIESLKKTYWGIDQAAITFSYAFDLEKKGGKR